MKMYIHAPKMEVLKYFENDKDGTVKHHFVSLNL